MHEIFRRIETENWNGNTKLVQRIDSEWNFTLKRSRKHTFHNLSELWATNFRFKVCGMKFRRQQTSVWYQKNEYNMKTLTPEHLLIFSFMTNHRQVVFMYNIWSMTTFNAFNAHWWGFLVRFIKKICLCVLSEFSKSKLIGKNQKFIVELSPIDIRVLILPFTHGRRLFLAFNTIHK